jgi:hypothetical protein
MVVDYPVLYMIMQSSPYLGYYCLSKQKWNVEDVLSCDAIDQTSQIRLQPPQGLRPHTYPDHRRVFSRKARFANCFHLDYSQVKPTNSSISLRPTKLRASISVPSLVELSIEPAH